ncbi:carbonic anhydrase [Polymorphobacter fuscus]|uniref:carbonic anhydrase n=1 Tax=Sandarakinorhabdus fusca TaxID=1439888 RepID=A0A7C9LEN2_9SPHN|nr:carbonic anhydrase [Polymorphobacter fuscus]KAB7648530.1 carbonic anhydrase [Polymorphobacter fuscus]MQT16067.1 carbonic anhydrase [Polymorphobacter fuscus]NJC07655.1 carbonic anhydrase [Polymorphobacter fuscus]
MNEIEQLMLYNRAWAVEQIAGDPEYFNRQVNDQTPAFLWIGCSDSRVAPDQLTQAAPGGLFIHRNIANLVRPDDGNLMAVMDFAIGSLKIDRIVVCGHYGCGGIKSALEGPGPGPLGDWLQHAVKVYDDHRAEIDSMPDSQARSNRLVECNVRDQLLHVADSAPVRAAWAEGRDLVLHGWVYDLRDGLLNSLLEIRRDTDLADVARPDRVLV